MFSHNGYFIDDESDTFSEKLKKLLNAISLGNNVEYVKGMNFIAASLFWHCDEATSFYVLTQLFEKLEAHKHYSNMLSAVQYQVDHFCSTLLRNNSRNILFNLESKGVHPLTVFSEWFVTLGTSIIPIEYHISIIHNLTKDGWVYLYGVLTNYLQIMYMVFKDEDYSSTVSIIRDRMLQNGRVVEIDWAEVLRAKNY